MRASIVAAGLLALGLLPAHASPGDCYLQVGRRTYLDGLCNIILEPGGSFSIGAGERSRSRYFATVDIDPEAGGATGRWNGSLGAGHAQEELGSLVRQGGCWVNADAKVCAWRPGTRPATF